MKKPKTITRRELLKQAAALSLASLLPLSALIPETAPVAEAEPEAPKKRLIGKNVRIFFDTQEVSGEASPVELALIEQEPADLVRAGVYTTPWGDEVEFSFTLRGQFAPGQVLVAGYTEAYRAYADQVNRGIEELTTQEKHQAVINALLGMEQ